MDWATGLARLECGQARNPSRLTYLLSGRCVGDQNAHAEPIEIKSNDTMHVKD